MKEYDLTYTIIAPVIAHYFCGNVITAVDDWSQCNTDGTAIVTIHGDNYGLDNTAASVLIGAKSCTSIVIDSHQSLHCTVAAGPGSGLNWLSLNVVIGGQQVMKIDRFHYAGK